ncbi:CBS domain-containing protein [Schinkia azotoformans MEV2011]|uniref:CBS domain-containing protein n=1 Tax=Schinkia azotoformans MEV2011 TaxID=1348973 RepID=A0A072NXF3_SCHAZ|nr:hemolysin family protein [Schinkia azotoformans]KEF37915.1 CBS domain-containing protein [Schinkia azotoformans MEV2011]MEC1696597.1 hemolysin family protein [Schinkia azotoformans]MEC1716024.1 hemolysin family protein [Schinkia azotoformans]MEC1725912.1 hemolysin family protein [Schinkia azotoformans]MEC1740495.1 hemolysin family protein [Schinkia azotoformans]
MGTEILVLIVLILLNAFFAASEMALVSLNDNKIKLMADSGHKKAKMVQTLLNEPSRFLATIQIGITLAGFLASAFAAGSFAGRLAEFLYNLGLPLSQSTLATLSTVIITLILSYFTLVLGELVPKRLALQKAEQISFFAVSPLTVLSKITSPFVKFLTLSTNLMVRMFGLDPNADEEDVTEEEIRMMVDVGQEKGTILETEKQMINNIFEFDNKTVSDIMTHRTNIVAIPVETTLKEALHIANVEKYTRLPVYDEKIDNIVGILHVKDLFQFIESGDRESFNLRELVREPYYVLESIKIDQLFRDMQKNNVHMAIVIDEYGGTDGIITIEDLIEEIVGNIFDEYDEPEMDVVEIEEIDEYHYIMAGTTNLYEVEDILNIDLPIQDYDTLSGFMIGQLGYIPGVEERPAIEYKDIIFAVEEMNDRRIVKVKVSIKENVPEEA